MVRVQLVERTRVARGVTQHQLRVGVAHSHRRPLYPEGAGGSFLNAPGGRKVFEFYAKSGPERDQQAGNIPLGEILSPVTC